MYVKKLFTDNEEILVRLRLHWIQYILPVLLTIIGFVITGDFQEVNKPNDPQAATAWISVICFVIAGYYWLRNLTTEMVVTNHRIINKKGIMVVHMAELRNIKVESLGIHQTIPGRIFDYGDIVFTGTGNTDVVFEYISSPAQTMAYIKSIIDENNSTAQEQQTKEVVEQVMRQIIQAQQQNRTDDVVAE